MAALICMGAEAGSQLGCFLYMLPQSQQDLPSLLYIVSLRAAKGQGGNWEASYGPCSEVTRGHFCQSLLAKERLRASSDSEGEEKDCAS